MPKKYWRNLPEASLIKPLIEGAERLTGGMIADAATAPHKAQKRPERAMPRKPPASVGKHRRRFRDEAADCRACPLWKDATQTVFGEGPQHAPHHAGRRAARRQGRPRRQAVRRTGRPDARPRAGTGRHRRATRFTSPMPSSISSSCRAEKSACTRSRTRRKSGHAGNGTNANWRSIKPDLVVAMGATAAQSVFGKITPINKNRGRVIELEDGTRRW